MDEIQSIRNEIESLGFTQLLTPQDVDDFLEKHTHAFIFVNSYCPNSTLARTILKKLTHTNNTGYGTVLAGTDHDATIRAREYFKTPNSSPSIFILKDKQVVLEITRDEILKDREKILLKLQKNKS